MKLQNVIIKAVKNVAKRVSKDYKLLSYENDFTVMFYHELMKDKSIKKQIINTEWKLSDDDEADMVIYDKKQVIKVNRQYGGLEDYDVKHFKAILEFKISWGRCKANKIKVSKEDINKLKWYISRADNLYYILMDINKNEDFEKKDLSKLKIKCITLIYSNPTLNKFYCV